MKKVIYGVMLLGMIGVTGFAAKQKTPPGKCMAIGETYKNGRVFDIDTSSSVKNKKICKVITKNTPNTTMARIEAIAYCKKFKSSLASELELLAIYDHRTALTNAGITFNAKYWSSEVVNGKTKWGVNIDFNKGKAYGNPDDLKFNVICVQSFEMKK